MKITDLKPLAVDAKDLGEMLGVSVFTIRRWEAAGRLPKPSIRSKRTVRWSVKAIEDWLAESGQR